MRLNSMMPETPTSLAAEQALANELLRVWYRDETVSQESRAAAARALDGVDWDAASCSVGSKPQALYLRGALLLLSAAPSPTPAAGPDRRRAASLMEAAVKLQPLLLEAWVCLGAMHSQAGQLVMALHCLSCGLSAGLSREGLRQMSLVLRRLAASTGALPQERAEAAAASLASAKQAVAMDVADGFSWYVLGMAHVAAASAATLPLPAAAAAPAAGSCDQSSTHQLKQQQQRVSGASASCSAEVATADASARAALAAFTAAERAGLVSLPELWFNRAAVALHLGDLAQALQDFSTAGRMDPALPAAAQVAGITRLLAALAAFAGIIISSSSRPAGLQAQQAAALKAALSRDQAASLPEQLLPAGYHLVTWQQLQQQQQSQANSISKASSSRGTPNHKPRGITSSGSSVSTIASERRGDTCSAAAAGSCKDQAAHWNRNGSNSSSASRAALHCRIAAVMERLPGCAQWVCVAMSSCGGCFPLLLPGALDLQRLLGCCVLLLEPRSSSVAMQPSSEAQQALGLVLVRLTDAGSVIVPGGSSSSSGRDKCGWCPRHATA